MEIAALIDLPVEVAILFPAQPVGCWQRDHFVRYFRGYQELHMGGTQDRLDGKVGTGGHHEMGLLQERGAGCGKPHSQGIFLDHLRIQKPVFNLEARIAGQAQMGLTAAAQHIVQTGLGRDHASVGEGLQDLQAVFYPARPEQDVRVGVTDQLVRQGCQDPVEAPILPRLCWEQTRKSIQPSACSFCRLERTSAQLPLSNTSRLKGMRVAWCRLATWYFRISSECSK